MSVAATLVKIACPECNQPCVGKVPAPNPWYRCPHCGTPIAGQYVEQTGRELDE